MTVKISSTGPAKRRWNHWMGVYSRAGDLYQRGRPVYEQEEGEAYLFLSGNDDFTTFCCVDHPFSGTGRWMVGRDYTKDFGGITSVRFDRVGLWGQDWQYGNGTHWLRDNTLKVQFYSEAVEKLAQKILRG